MPRYILFTYTPWIKSELMYVKIYVYYATYIPRDKHTVQHLLFKTPSSNVAVFCNTRIKLYILCPRDETANIFILCWLSISFWDGRSNNIALCAWLNLPSSLCVNSYISPLKDNNNYGSFTFDFKVLLVSFDTVIQLQYDKQSFSVSSDWYL